MNTEEQQAHLADCLAKTALGNRAAFKLLYEAASAKLFGVVLRIVINRDIAEEILQECFVTVWHRAGDYRQGLSQPMTWLSTIARNRALDHVRRIKLDDRELTDVLIDTTEDTHTLTPEALAVQTAESIQVHRCLEALDGKQRQAVSLAFFHGLSHSEVSDQLESPVGTIKSHIRRGLLKMKTCLGIEGALV